MKFVKALILPLLVISLLFAGCGSETANDGNDPSEKEDTGTGNGATSDLGGINEQEWNNAGGNHETGNANDNDTAGGSQGTDNENRIEDMLKDMSLNEKIGQMLVIGVDGTAMDDKLENHLQMMAPGGVILFDRNSESPSQLLDFTNSIKKANSGRIPLIISVDEEGGKVSRMPPQLHGMPSAGSLGQIDDITVTYEAGSVIAQMIKSFGFNMDFAPVLDIWSNPENTVIGERAFGAVKETVIKHGIQMMKGIRDNGVIPVVKHFPGHGDTDVDSHVDLPSVKHGRDRLDNFEMAPFRAAITENADAVMVAHILVGSVDPELPATLSETVINGILRGELGFDGVVITDDMTMGAISKNYDIGDAAVKAVIAGCDIILVCHGYERQIEAFNAIKASVEAGRIDMGRIDESVARILRLKDKYNLSDDIIDNVDVDSINEKIDELVYNR